ncbi:MAG: hypothetical protein HS115_09070 [Spirochaetales bacterium]|nr:hypothetical protein [Spirochaetales bacterium]
MEGSSGNFRHLRASRILSTIDQLEKRIAERFPASSLRQVCREFRELAGGIEELAHACSQPIWPVRLVVYLAASLLLMVASAAAVAVARQFSLTSYDIADLLQIAESAINELIFLGLALVFLTGLEMRMKRRRILAALDELRSIAHVVDMHQLTKDPASLLAAHLKTESSPERTLSRYQLTRYLDYCSELLALNSKVAALFAQGMQDPVVLSAVNDLESLNQGLSQKVWQKIMILDLAEG